MDDRGSERVDPADWPLPVYEPPTAPPSADEEVAGEEVAGEEVAGEEVPGSKVARQRSRVVVAGVAIALAGVVGVGVVARTADTHDATVGDLDGQALAYTQPADLGTAGTPASFGTVLQASPSWYVAVTDARPAGGLVASFSDQPATGNVFVAVDLQITYAGPEVAAYPGFLLSAYGASEYTTYDTSCILEGDGIRSAATMAREQTATFTVCVEVPAGEVDTLVYGVRGPGSFGEPLSFSPNSSATFDPPPIEVLEPAAGPPGSSGDPLDLGADPVDLGEGLTGTITDTADAVDDDLLADFALPPEDGRAYVVAEAQLRNDGTEPVVPRVFVVAVGAEAYEPFTSECFLADDAAAFDELAPGDERTVRYCMDVPADEVDDLRFTLTGPSGEAVVFGE